MEEGSSAILPSNKTESQQLKYQHMGKAVSFSVPQDNLVEIRCENAFLSLYFYSDRLVRVIMNPNQVPSLKTSMAVVKEPENVKCKVTENENELIVSSGMISVTVSKQYAQVSVLDSEGQPIVQDTENSMGYNGKREVICHKQMKENDHFYGFGEKTGFLDKRGEEMTMWNTDVFDPHNPEIDPLYQSIPYFMTVRDGKAYGIFLDNTSRTVFNMRDSDESYSFSADVGQLDYYVLTGPAPKDVLGQYWELTGKMPIPPKWALGYHQSRYSYETEQEVRELTERFKEKEIPLDAVYLDIHYMDGFRVFTFDSGNFPNPAKLVEDLKADGIHVIPIVDPGVKEDPEYVTYQEGVRGEHFSKYIEGNIFFGDVWPGNSAFPDFTDSETRKWWGDRHSFYTELGIEGIWNDMNEPSVFNETKTMDVKVVHSNNGDPKTHRELHNEYGLLMGEATYEGMKRQLGGKRPFLLTRAGYSGIQRYAAVWTGDNRSFWEHLQMSIPMCMNLGISGVPFCGPDIGGFAHHSSGELLARWTQTGAFMPYFRNHSVLGSDRQEPWSFGPKYEAVIKKYIQERYVWLPHLYNLFRQTSVTGLPIMRPLVLEFPDDKNTFNLSDQFMLGEDVLVAPVVLPDRERRMVYLPEGEWIEYWEDKPLSGNQHIIAEAPIDRLPLFVKKGAIIAHGPARQSASEKLKEITMHVYLKEQGTCSATFYDDDGQTFEYEKGAFYEENIEARYMNGEVRITIAAVHSGYLPDWQEQRRIILHQVQKDTDIFVNGEVIPDSQLSFENNGNTAVFTWCYNL